MMIPRKRQRPNPQEASSSSLPAPSLPRESSASTPSSAISAHGGYVSRQIMPTQKSRGSDQVSSLEPHKQVRKARSWYGPWPGTPSKATASTSVSRENVTGGTIRSCQPPDLSRFELKSAETGSVRSASGAASIRSRTSQCGRDGEMAGDHGQMKDSQHRSKQEPTKASADSQQAPSRTCDAPATPERPATSSGWLGWWSRTPFTEAEATLTPPPPLPPVQASQSSGPSASSANGHLQPLAEAPPHQSQPASTSWFGFWSSGGESTPKSDTETVSSADAGPKTGSEDVLMREAPPGPELNRELAPKAGSTWAFWARDFPKDKNTSGRNESGQIAVIGEGSETHPKAMTEGDMPSSNKGPKEEPRSWTATTIGKSTWKRNKRQRPPSMDADTSSLLISGASAPNPEQAQMPELQESKKTLSQTGGEPSSQHTSERETSAKVPQNLLLPSFSSTYHLEERPSIIKQVAQFLLRTSQPPASRVTRIKDPPAIRKAIAIGVHGLVPAMYLRPMIGQPTGTSLRFANLCAEAIRRWADSYGCSECEIEKVALEGEGKIGERVDNLWKLMLNWIEHIRNAELIVIASHSQGVPVSIMLLDKLIDLGIITNAKIGVCAMAGVSLGPFPDYKSSFLMGSAAELWEFGNPESANSLRFETALRNVLNYGARVTFVGSIDDQLVPMESAVYCPANHPYIYRAVFIDGRTHAADFIAHLVGFALKLRNLGISDHGLIHELSVPLAGSLYSGEGHSRLYYDAAVYDLAVSHALETSTVPQPLAGQVIAKRNANGPPNPYVLPWIMRGLLEEDFVRTELRVETEELLKQFDDWKPTNKALRDVKFRLEAVRSKL